MWNRIEKLLPRYVHIPLLTACGMNILAYYGTRLLTANAYHYDISLPLDDMIPLCPAFIVIYILSYLQWAIGFIIIARESREICYRIIGGEIIAKCLCIILFLAFPTALVRPEITGDGLFSFLTRLIYALDEPNTLFPSIHCLESWICLRGAMAVKKTPRWYLWVSLVFTLLVFASTVFTKQHVLLDIPAGIAVAEIGLFLSAKFGFGRLFERAEQAFVKG